MDVRRGMLLGTLFLGGCGVAANPTTPASPSTPAAEPSAAGIRAIGDEPVIGHDDLAAPYVLPATAIEVDGVVHAWVVTFSDTAGVAPQVEHLTSPDARTWTAAGEPARFDGLDLDPNGPIPSSVLVNDDGTWVMYGSARLPIGTPVIWRATAAGPDGPWRLDDEPVLAPAAGTWASAVVDHPSVVVVDDGYLMAFGGASLADVNRNRIGFALSTDGVAWELVDAALADADDDRALGPIACGVDARTMFEPQLLEDGSGWRLYFGQMRLADDAMVVGSATSHDGASWTCASDAASAFAPDDLPGAPGIHSYLAFDRRGVDHLLLETLGAESASSDVWLLTSS